MIPHEKKIGPELWHNDWYNSPEVISQNGAKLEEIHQREMSIVKLKFGQLKRCKETEDFYEEECMGTGFYIHIPEVKQGWYTCNGDNPATARSPNSKKLPNHERKYDIILTAGHNLIGTDGQMSKNIRVERVTIVTEDGKPVYEKEADIPVSESQVMISEKYRQNPGTHNSQNDWGVLLLERNGNVRGFGINLLFGLDDDQEGHESLIRQSLAKNQVTIAGYQSQGWLRYSSGTGRVKETGEIEYEAQTEQGLSGSPVWIQYQGLATVIAIHVCGSKGNSTRSRGSRISFELLEQLYRWANLGYFSKSLKATQTKKVGVVVDYPKGLYLRFPTLRERAKVRLGAEGLQTTFDVLPALTEPAKAVESNTGDQVHYVFRMHSRGEGRESKSHQWVLWNIDMNKVSLVESIHPSCLVKLLDGTIAAQSFKVVYSGGQNQNKGEYYYTLTMETKRLRVEDEDMGIPAETSEVSLSKEIVLNRFTRYNHFRFEACL